MITTRIETPFETLCSTVAQDNMTDWNCRREKDTHTLGNWDGSSTRSPTHLLYDPLVIESKKERLG